MLPTLAPDAFEVFLQLLYPVSSKPAVGLDLRLARPAGADSAAETLKVRPLSGESREQVLVLGQLDLESAFPSLSPGSEHIQYQRSPVDDLSAYEGVFEIALLARGQLVVADDRVYAQSRAETL